MLSLMLCFAAAAAFVALLVLALALGWWCLCLLSLGLPGVVGWLLPIEAGLLHDVVVAGRVGRGEKHVLL